MIAPTEIGKGGALSTDVDSLAVASGGLVTEDRIAKNGAHEGDAVGDLEWTLGKITPTGVDNINDTITLIGLGAGDVDNHSSYALIVLESDSDQDGVTMQVGSDDSIKVWLNGEVVHKNAVDRGASDFQETFQVDIKKGDNLLLVKVSELWGGWAMFVGIQADVRLRTPTVRQVRSSDLVSLLPASVQSPNIGQQLKLSLKIANGENVAGYQATVQFDDTALRFVSGTNGKFLPVGAFLCGSKSGGQPRPTQRCIAHRRKRW